MNTPVDTAEALRIADALAWQVRPTSLADMAAAATTIRTLVAERDALLARVGDAQAVRFDIDVVFAINVFDDVLADISDWEDQALAEAVREAQSRLRPLASPPAQPAPSEPVFEHEPVGTLFEKQPETASGRVSNFVVRTTPNAADVSGKPTGEQT